MDPADRVEVSGAVWSSWVSQIEEERPNTGADRKAERGEQDPETAEDHPCELPAGRVLAPDAKLQKRQATGYIRSGEKAVE